MGRGDQRTRKGKIAAGSYGKTRPKKKKNANQAAEDKGSEKKGK